MTPAETKRSPISNNLPVFLLAALLVLAVVAVVFLVNSRTTLKKDNVAKDSQIVKITKDFNEQLDSLRVSEEKLSEQVKSLTSQKEKLASSKDSVLRLLNYALANDRNSKGKVAQLEKSLREIQAKLGDVQKMYDDLLASSGSSGAEYKQRLEALSVERDNLAKENQDLKKQLATKAETGDNQKSALFTSGAIVAQPGELKSGKFSASTRSQNTDRVQISFSLTRAPKADEQLLFRIYDATNKEVAVNPSYRKELTAPANPVNQKLMLVFEKMLDRKSSGRFSVRLYLTSTDKGIANQEIGQGTFTLK